MIISTIIIIIIIDVLLLIVIIDMCITVGWVCLPPKDQLLATAAGRMPDWMDELFCVPVAGKFQVPAFVPVTLPVLH